LSDIICHCCLSYGCLWRLCHIFKLSHPIRHSQLPWLAMGVQNNCF
jgi:hypothetical protein